MNILLKSFSFLVSLDAESAAGEALDLLKD
jgi:hypothetical protein